MTQIKTISIEAARRLALSAQGLDGDGARRVGTDAAGIEEIVRRINYVQLDPISVVARSPLLVLWARLGAFDETLLDDAVYGQRLLFEYWAHAAAIVPTADLALYRWKMRTYPPESHGQVRSFMAENAAIAEAILAQLAASSEALPAQAFESRDAVRWKSSGWTAGRDIDRMLTFLWTQGKVVVARRRGGKRLWQLAANWFPADGSAAELEDAEALRRGLARALIALGTGTERQAASAFTGWGVKAELGAAFGDLIASGEVLRVSVADEVGGPLRGDWMLHRDHLAMLELIEAGEWEGRSVLLSPFDNLIIDRGRAEALFGFEHRMEIYVPAAQRRWGYYVLPYLHGDRIAGRLDVRADRKRGRLSVLAVHAEDWAAKPPGGLRPLRRALADLAGCCGLEAVEFAPEALAGAPTTWSRALK